LLIAKPAARIANLKMRNLSAILYRHVYGLLAGCGSVTARENRRAEQRKQGNYHFSSFHLAVTPVFVCHVDNVARAVTDD